jgi:hypothetical protein
MGDWIDQEFEKLRQKRDTAQQRNEVLARVSRQKWQELVEAVSRDAAKLDRKLAELMQSPASKVITVTTNGESITVDKQSPPNYRVCLRLEVPAKAIRIERQVVIVPENAKREVSERLDFELTEEGEVRLEHPQQGPMTIHDVSKYVLLPIVTTLEKVLSRQ